jgi:hypothetical protein
MKKMLFLLILVSVNTLAADEKPIVPELLKDSKIVTTLKSGKQVSFDGNEWMVVRRKAPKKLEEKLVLLPAQESSSPIHKQPAQKMNRARLIGGVGPRGFDSTTKANYVEINSKSGVIGGVGYDRLLNEAVSVGGQVLSNGTMALSLGLDF